MLSKGFFVGWMLMFSATFSWSQSQYFRRYQVEDGLSHNTVICSYQDSDGFMWFGTKDGLNRFDGYSFKIFRSIEGDSTSLGCNFVQHLFEYGGILWVGTDEGLYQYHPETESFTLFNPAVQNTIRDVVADREDNLWFISGYTLYRYNFKMRELEAFNTEKYFYATSVCLAPEGSVWVSTREGLLRKYDSNYRFFAQYDIFANSPTTDTRWIEKIVFADTSAILVGTQSQGIKLFDVKSATYADVKMHDESGSSLFVRDFVKSGAHEYWVATESGIYIYDLKKNTFKNLNKNYSNPYSLSDNAVYTLFSDREGGIWAGTYFGGINYFPRQYTPFEKFFPKPAENSISGNAVREICADRNGNLWIGTEDAGLNKFDPETGSFTHFMPTGRKGGLSHYNIHGLLATGDELWIGTFHHGLDVMDINTGKIIRHYSANDDPGGLKSNFIYSIIKTSQGDILTGTSNGLYRYNPAEDNFTIIPAYPGAYEYTVMIMEDHQGVIWAGTYNNGVYYIDPASQKRGYFKNEPGNPESLSSNFINSIFEDSKNNLWFATNSGFCRLNRTDSVFTRYTTENGLPSNVIYRIEEDKNGVLWVSTSKGLVQFDPETESLKVYTTANGLLSDQFNYNSSYKSPGGQMYFGSVQGLVRFDPDGFIKNDFIPPVHITGLQINNQEVPVNQKGSPLKKSVTRTGEITLNYHQSSFSLDFAALSYTAPEMTEYKFTMEGLQDGWTYLPTNRKVYFTELAPGEYTFKVIAANSSGIWSEVPAILHVEILPPFWASGWAYTVYGLIVILILFWVFRYYHRQTERKNRNKIQVLENEKEKEIYQAKIEFFTNVAHEIRTPLTLITGPLEKALGMPLENPSVKGTLTIMQKNANRLLELTNQLLDFRKTETRQFSLTFVRYNIRMLVEDVFTRFKPAIEEKKLQVNLNLPGHDVFAYVDPEALTKIISNLLGNAVKFAQHQLSVKLSSFDVRHDSRFHLEVSNDGNLIPEDMKERVFQPFFRLNETRDQKGTGIGLPLARSLAELHNGELQMEKGNTTMNTFVLTLPVRQENEFKLFEESDAPAAVLELADENEADESRPSLLVVEDNREMLAFISAELRHDYQLYEARNGKEALQILDKENIHVVVSDIMMPLMDGLALCRQIKDNIEYSHIPVILLTAKNSLQSKIEGLESGADVYIEKPFSVEHLKVQIANLLANKEKIRQYFTSNPLSHIKSMAHSRSDELFLEKLNEVIYDKIADPDLNVDYLADKMNMSKPTLYRKIKTVSNLTPNELINLARLKKAAELLVADHYKIYEVAHMVGYNSQTSFGRNFHKQFGMTPSEFISAKETSA